MLYGKGVVQARPVDHFFEVVWSALHRLPTTLAVSSGHERVLTPLLLILPFGRTTRGAFVNTLVPPCLALEAVEDRSDHLLAQGMANGDVKELLGGSRALTS